MNKMKLFCFPYAGGSSDVYRNWKKYLDPSIELYPVELSGRGRRMSEPLYENMQGLIEDVFRKIEPELKNSTYAFFGHSLGSMVVFELTRKLLQDNIQLPEVLFVSGRKAPHLKRKPDEKLTHTLNEEEFIEEIMKLGGTPKELLEHKELLDLFLPVIRKDYKIAEQYVFNDKNVQFNSDLVVLYGTKDEATYEEMLEWKAYSSRSCNFYSFEDGHFFINNYTQQIVDLINNKLKVKK